MKIKGAMIIHAKFRGARKLMKINIQDLTLRRYDAIRSKDQ